MLGNKQRLCDQKNQLEWLIVCFGRRQVNWWWDDWPREECVPCRHWMAEWRRALLVR